MFSFITMNWRGRPLVNYRTIVELVANTSTTKRLKIRAERDTEHGLRRSRNDYFTGKIVDHER
jgi:hypothetical protein